VKLGPGSARYSGQAMRPLLAVLLAFAIGCSDPAPSTSVSLPDLAAFPEPVAQKLRDAVAKLDENPENASAVGELAMILDAYEQTEAAEAYYAQAAQLQPRAVQWTYLRGVALEKLGRDGEAAEAFREAISVQPGYGPTRLRLADLERKLGARDEATELYESVLGMNPNSATAELGLGRIALDAGEVDAAVERLERAAAMAPDFPATRFALAEAYRTAGRPEDAARELASYERGSKRIARIFDDPLLDSVESMREGEELLHVERGARLEQQGEFQAAVAEYEKALEANPKSVLAHSGMISAYGVLQKYEEAERHYELAVAIDSEVEELHYNFGVLRSIQGRYEEGIAAFRRSLELNPNQADTQSNLGFALETTGKRAEALTHYRAALKAEPNHRLANYHLGRNLLDAGKAKEAVPHLERVVIVEDQRSSHYLGLLAEALRRSGRAEEAKKVQARADGLK